MKNKQVENVMKVIKHQVPNEVPVVFWGGGPFSNNLFNIKEIDYYKNIEIKINVFVKMFEMFPEAVFFPGFWPDYGTVTIASAFGSKVLWQEREAPFAEQFLTSAQDIDKLKPADPYKSGLMPQCLKEWEYLWKHVDRKWIDDYGYLDGNGWVMGPIESSAQIRGYSDFFLEIYEYPDKIHKLLDIVTEGILEYLKAQERINGKIKRICICDHVASQISPDHFREFYVPYIKRIFDEFDYAEVKVWHNEGTCKHLLSEIPNLGCNVWHFGDDDPIQAKEALKGKVTLMGNVNPVKYILQGTPEDVINATYDLLQKIGNGGGLLLSSGGGMSPGTKSENVRALIDTLKKYNQEQL